MSQAEERRGFDFLSLFRERDVRVQVRTSPLNDGMVGIWPAILVDGENVPDVTQASRSVKQAVQRYVDETPLAQATLARIPAEGVRLSKPKAAEVMLGLIRLGIHPRSRDGAERVAVLEAKPQVRLRLSSSGGLRVTSKLVAVDGTLCRKPTDIGAVRSDGGWYWSGGNLVRVALTGSSLDKLLLAEGGNGTLINDDVPRCLRLIERYQQRLGQVRKDEGLDGLKVFETQASGSITIDGTESVLSVTARMTLAAAGGPSYAFSQKGIPELVATSGSFLRVNEGWLEVGAPAVAEFEAAWRSVSAMTDGRESVNGNDIPEVLERLEQAAATPGRFVKVVVTPAFRQLHRVVRAPWVAQCEIDIDDGAGNPYIRLTPRYRCDGHFLAFGLVENAVANGERWLRVDGAWVAVDAKLHERVGAMARLLGLHRSGDTFVFEPKRLQEVRKAFSAFAEVITSAEYAERVTRATAKGTISINAKGESIVLEPELVITTVAGQSFQFGRDRIPDLAKNSSGFYRVGDGWVEVDPTSIQQFVTSWESVGACTGGQMNVEGSRIPEILEGVRRLIPSVPRRLVEIVIAPEVANLHRILKAPWSAQCEIDVDEAAGSPQIRLTPRYRCGGHALDYGWVERAVADGERWLRLDGVWAAVDAKLHERVDAMARLLGLHRSGDTFVFEAKRLQEVRKAFAAFAEVVTSAEYAERVTSAKAKGTVRIDATEESITITPTLALTTPDGRTFQLGEDRIPYLANNSSGLYRVGDGWVEVAPIAIQQFVANCESVASITGGRHVITGSEILEVLTALRQLRAGGGILAELVCAANVERLHRVVNAPWAAVLILDIDEAGEAPQLMLTPRFGHRGDEFGEDDIHQARSEGTRWLRSAHEWQLIHQSLFERVTEAIAALGLSRSEDAISFVLPADRRDEVLSKLKRLAAIEPSDAYEKRVFVGQAHGQITIDASPTELTVSSRLEVSGNDDRSHAFSADDLSRLEGRGGLIRIDDGWVDINPEIIAAFAAASRAVAACTRNRDRVPLEDIPGVLDAFDAACSRGELSSDPLRSYVALSYTPAVSRLHKRVTTQGTVECRIGVVESEGSSLLHLDPVYDQEEFRLSQAEVRQAIEDRAKWIRKPSGWVRVPRQNYNKIEQLAKSLDLVSTSDGFVVPPIDHTRVIDTFSAVASITPLTSYTDFVASLSDFTAIQDASLPRRMQATVSLRDYQRHGYNWLVFLQKYGFGGVLADDMGLGKTLQTLLAIEHRNDSTGTFRPSLIVCPASVLFNWEKEIRKFLVDVDVYVFHGDVRRRSIPKLERVARQAKRDGRSLIVLTSFDTARIDCDDLAKMSWRYLVVDEAHNIKNPGALRTKAIKKLPAQHKVALTGTPLQNSLDDLWSLFDFAMPGYLGTRKNFRDTYGSSAVGSHGDGDTDLSKRIRPFVLRRLKQHVAKDLPEKLVIDISLRLTPKQVLLYKSALASREHAEILEQIEDTGLSRSRIAVLALLTKLRTICNHPALSLGIDSPGQAKVGDSGKLAYLEAFLDELIAGDHRALLFSQSTRMLDVLQHYFDAWRVPWLRLDGGTPVASRGKLAEQFNSDASIKCFLLSTKAAGVGLNLVGADTVIFFDHDWNPANDNQAMDRVYRIGQTRNVTVYRLITAGTIEDKILERQRHKQAVADSVVGVDADGFKDITKEEVMQLLTLDVGDGG